MITYDEEREHEPDKIEYYAILQTLKDLKPPQDDHQCFLRKLSKSIGESGDEFLKELLDLNSDTLWAENINSIVENQEDVDSQSITMRDYLEREMLNQPKMSDIREYKRNGLIETVAVFVDVSNVTAGITDSDLDMSEMINFVINGRIVDRKFAAGSFPSLTHKIWTDIEQVHGFDRYFQKNPGKENGVDDILHAQILKYILEHQHESRNKTIVIVSGDGNSNCNRTSFQDASTLLFF